MLEIKAQNPNQLNWKDRHPSDYTFSKIDVSQFLSKKNGSKKTIKKATGKQGSLFNI